MIPKWFFFIQSSPFHRGIKNIFNHRTLASGIVSGSIRYKVLLRAKNRCESCGISNDKKQLEVDHIIPRSKGGKDELSNFQALCYTCNSQKSNKDDTNFRKVLESYDYRKKKCIFCNIPKSRIISSNELAVVIKDNYPVTKHHCLIIPKRVYPDYFDSTLEELKGLNELIFKTKEFLDNKYQPTGYNIGVNSGEDSGQTVFHLHVHILANRVLGWPPG